MRNLYPQADTSLVSEDYKAFKFPDNRRESRNVWDDMRSGKWRWTGSPKKADQLANRWRNQYADDRTKDPWYNKTLAEGVAPDLDERRRRFQEILDKAGCKTRAEALVKRA